MSRKKPTMGVQPPVKPRWATRFSSNLTGGPGSNRLLRQMLDGLAGPYTTILTEPGVEYSVPTKSIQRGAYDRP